MVRPPKRIVPNPPDPESAEAPVQRRSTGKSRYMTSGPQPAAQQPVPPRRQPSAPTVPHPERTVSPPAAPRASKFDARGSRGVAAPDEPSTTGRAGSPPQPQYSARGRRVLDLREGARRGKDEVVVDLRDSGSRMAGSARRARPGATPPVPPSQQPPSARTFTKGRHMSVPTPPTPPPVKPTPRRPDPAPPAPHPERSVAPKAAPRSNKFDARGSGSSAPPAPSEPIDTSGEPVYSVRGREIVDLREEARKAAEEAAVVDLTDRAADEARADQ